jgi:tetratricopeptide (TPR) repeat protein
MKAIKQRSGVFLFTGIFFLLGAFSQSIPAASKTCGQPKSEAEIRSLLKKWRDQIRPGLSAQEVKLVEEKASALPLDLPAGQLSATFEDSETKTDIKVDLKAQRRDMAYALAGFGYTFLGGNFAGQEKMKDMGLWCFLEAALLKLISPHLLNVGFHLNERGAYDDALSVLCYAAALSPNSPPVHNNLAYNLAARGNFKEAVDEAAQALSLEPDKDSYRRRLKYYGKEAGVKVDSLMPQSGAPPAGQGRYSQAFVELWYSLNQKYQSFDIDCKAWWRNAFPEPRTASWPLLRIV